MPKTLKPTPTDYSSIGRTIFGDAAQLVIAHIDDYSAHLQQEELALLNNAIDKRILEFSTGRYCAHLALQKIGVDPNIPLLKGKYREPLWPTQTVGSISHCRDLAGAVVAKKASIQSLGFDVENHKTLDQRITRHICTAAEADWLGNQLPDRQNLALLIIFSIKESIFKCIYQACGFALRFQQCTVVPDFDNCSVHAKLNIEVNNIRMENCQVRFHYTDSHIYSGASLFAQRPQV